jgi:uncharacterized protein YllA (UPF0747 family)
LFASAHDQEVWWVNRNTNRTWRVEEYQAELQNLFERLGKNILDVDPTLAQHIAAFAQQTNNKMEGVSKKVLRAEKRSMSDALQQLTALRAKLFPGGSLQERKENFSYFFAKYGTEWMHAIHRNSLGLEQEFTIVHI